MRYLHVIVGFCVVALSMSPASADIFLKKNGSGKITLTNSPSDDGMVKGDYQRILRTDVRKKYNISSPGELRNIVESASSEHDIPESLIYAVIDAESDGETEAISEDGAIGLMQLMPGTASEMGVENIMDPRENIFGGTKYLKQMLNRFNGDIDLSVAAYNAGPGAVSDHDGVPPYAETQKFVRRVISRFNEYRMDEKIIYTYYDENGVLHVTNIH